jgi:6,7-dimethyl-8-ribityllumazine synthase
MTRIEAGGPEAGETSGFRFALVVSKYNEFVTDRLQSGAEAALTDAGIAAHAMTVVRVPGAFEIPLAAEQAARTRRAPAASTRSCVSAASSAAKRRTSSSSRRRSRTGSRPRP